VKVWGEHLQEAEGVNCGLGLEGVALTRERGYGADWGGDESPERGEEGGKLGAGGPG
jgi:hypothetical protein